MSSTAPTYCVLREGPYFDYYGVGDNVYRRPVYMRSTTEADLCTGAPLGSRWECYRHGWEKLNELLDAAAELRKDADDAAEAFPRMFGNEATQ